MQYDFDDIVLTQAPVGLNSRSEAIIDYLPLIVAPMDTVIDENNLKTFTSDNALGVAIPRGLFKLTDVEKWKELSSSNSFISIGLDELVSLVDGELKEGEFINNILIDVANGNMPKLHEYIIKAKNKYSNLFIMAGNVGSAYAFKQLASTGVNYIRIGIGGGQACLTSVQTGIGQGMASLIMDCYEMKKNYTSIGNVQIVADGGFKDYRDIIIALNLGADYVMAGGIFSKCVESCGDKFIKYGEKDYSKIESAKDFNLDKLIEQKQLYSAYRGMSTKAVQRSWGKDNPKTSEGIEKYNLVEYKLEGWLTNFHDYLRSAMSYSGTRYFADFIGNQNYEIISPSTLNRFKK